MLTIYYLDCEIFYLHKFKDISKDDLPGYEYRRLHQMLVNRVADLVDEEEEEEVKLLYNQEKHLFALLYDGICIVDGDEEDEEEFLEEFLLFED